MAVLALAASLLAPGGAEAQVAPTPTAAPTAPVQTPFPRPEDPDAPLRAAVAEARKQNKPVEVTGTFTETSRTWALPDGSLKTESYSGPAQVKQQDGSWAWIDTTLVERDGVLRPKVAKADLAFSLGGDDVPFAVMKRDADQSLSLSWDGKLPRPVVKGNVATYPDAAGPAADLVVTALPTGFRHDVVLRERPTGPLEIRVPVESDELTLGKSRQGGLELTDAKDEVVARAPRPVMWDSTGAGARDPKTTAAPRSAPIATSVVEDGGKRTLVLKPDAGWLADPATTFPVVVDPTSTLTVKTDTLLSNGADCNTYDQPGATPLKVGAAYYSCRGVDAMNYWRSYLKFDVTGLAGKPIVSSTMQLWRTESPGCHLRGNGKIYASRLGADWTPGRMTWANKPGGTADFVSTPCPTTGVLTPGVMTWPITNWVKAWAGGQPNHGVELMGPSESLDRYSGYSAVFHSAETTGTGATPPKLITQYILPPEIPTVTAESVDSMDGEHAIVRESSAKVGYKSTSVDGRNLDYYVSVVDSTAPLPTWTTGGGEVGKWSFTEGTEGTDSSGRNNPLIFVSGRYSWVNGKDGKALSLNGSVGVPSTASTEDPVLRTDRSFSAAGWVRLEAGTGSVRLISQSGSLNSAFAVGYDAGSGKWDMEMYRDDTATSTVTEIRSSAAAQIGTWTHLTGVYDAVAKKIRLYVNGVQVAEADHTTPPWQAGQTFELGGGKGGGYTYSSVKAAYDEIRAYDRALSPTEIQWMLNLTPPTNANLPSGQSASITYDVGNVDSFKVSVRACVNGATPITCSESPYYRITTDAPYLPADTETGMADPTRPILSGMVNRPSGGPVTAKYFLYDSTGAPVGSSPFGERTVNGGERASFQVPENTVQLGGTYNWQMQACALEICTAKTAPVSFTIPGTPPEPPAETVNHLTLLKDSFVIKTAKVDPTACDGSPCTVTDSTVMRIGGSGTDKTVAVIGFKLGELPDGAGVSEGILKLGTPTCPAGTCPADAVITATPLKSQVTGETRGSDLAGDADTDITPYSLPLSGPQVDIAGSEYQWLTLTSNKEEDIVFGDVGSTEQPSIALTYLPAGPPSKVLNVVSSPGDSGATVSWGIPETNGGVALLDGYDIEISDGNGVVRTLEVSDPTASVSGLTNGVTYTVKVRARTAFGVGEWESTTVTPKAVPPPPPPSSGTCGFGSGVRSQTASAQTESSIQEYANRIKNYYQAQDAVLEGRAATVWQAPGVTPSDSITAKISLLNTSLTSAKAVMDGDGIARVNSSVTVEDVVPQALSDGTVRVTAKVQRSWEETLTGSADVPVGARNTAVPAGQVEPSRPMISIFVFDRCGGFTIIDVPIEAEQDSTDFDPPFDVAYLWDSSDAPSASRAPATQSGQAEAGASSTTLVPPPPAGEKHWQYAFDYRPLRKNWMLGAAMASHWQDRQDCTERPNCINSQWKIKTVRNALKFYPKSRNFWTGPKGPTGSWTDSLGKYILKNSRADMTFNACFKVRKTTNVNSVGFNVGWQDGPSGLIEGSTQITTDLQGACPEPVKKKWRPGYPNKPITFDPDFVSGECDDTESGACQIRAYRSTLIGNLFFAFYNTGKDGKTHKDYLEVDGFTLQCNWVRTDGKAFANAETDNCVRSS